ncbi:carnosine synthase 1-like [Mytilus galloprovincialis]|uniref:carnosine synthase 1-like n=1 Tax=Mytilus galloprovincialis TaxID=29158 RepID=UPI003F7BE385
MITPREFLAMQGKTVLVIGVGGYCQRFIWDVYKEFGIKIVLVDPDDKNLAISKVTSFIEYDFLSHQTDQEHATCIIKILKEKGITIDGCVTFLDTCGPLAAIICRQQNLYGPGQEAAYVAKYKGTTYEVLKTKDQTKQFIVKCYQMNTIFDIESAFSYVGVPAVMKPENGCCGAGVKRITDLKQFKVTYENEALTHGNNFTLMEFIEGTQHGIELILFQRELIASFVTDYGPTRKDRFTETAATMPSCLSKDAVEELMTAAHKCCIGIGLVDGVFNIEMKMTSNGPKLIEMNARMPSFYIRDWVLICYGIDLLLYTFMTCLGIRPEMTKPVSTHQIMGIACVPSVHKEHLSKSQTVDLFKDMDQKGIISYHQLSNSLGECENDGNEIPFCSLAVIDQGITKTKEKLLKVWNLIGFNTDSYDVKLFLQHF